MIKFLIFITLFFVSFSSTAEMTLQESIAAQSVQIIFDNAESLKIAPKEEAKLGPIFLGESFRRQIGVISQPPNADCSLSSTVTQETSVFDAWPIFDVYCRAQILGAMRELKVTLTQLKPSTPSTKYDQQFVVSSIELTIFNPDRITLDALGEAIFHRWGLPESVSSQKNSNKTASNIAKLCDSAIGPLGTLKEYMERENCRSSISQNPLVQFISGVGDSETFSYHKNGVIAAMTKVPVNNMFVHGTGYNVYVTSDELMSIVEKVNDAKNSARTQNEKSAREKAVNSF